MSGSTTAKDLASAGPKDMIHVDAEGRVRSPTRLKLLQGFYWGAIALILVIEAFLGYALFGPAGLGIALTLGVLVAWRITKQVALKGATEALRDNRLREADRRFARLAASWVLPRLFRPIAIGRRAIAKEKAGELEEALELCREAIRRYGKSRHAEARLARYQEVRLLLRLGEQGEAKARFEALGDVPKGELFKLHHLTTELLLAFRRGAHSFGDEVLHEHATFALEINLAAPLIGLLAWAFDRNGDPDMAALMRETALERDVDGASDRYPDVWDWLEGDGRDDAPSVLDEVEVRAGASRRPGEKRSAR